MATKRKKNKGNIVESGEHVESEIDRVMFNNRVVELRGDVTEDNVNQLMRKLDVLDAFSTDPITLRISTYGGEFYPTLALIGFIRRMDSKVNCIVQGYAFSAGLYIAAACTGVRSIQRESVMLYHEVLLVREEGDVKRLKELSDSVRHTEKQMDFIKEILLKKTKLNKTFFEHNRNNDVVFTAFEALEQGIVDKIV